jgi:hypothetical protein
VHESKDKPLSYGNFNNPLGLVGRMLRSGNRAAYSALFREALGIGLKPADLLLSLLERRQEDRSDQSNPDQPLILVVGPPRGGTTLVYQVLAHCLDVSYTSNLMGLFPRSPITANRLSSHFLPTRPAADFRSYCGQSSRLSGGHDGFFIWNRWLGDDRYAPRTDLSESEVAKMREFFQQWTTAFPKPFLNKNNRNTCCIDLLAKTLPTARFLVVRRDPTAIVRSLIRAREKVQGDKQVPWGLLSSASNDHELSYVDDVCAQVSLIQQRLDEQLESIASNRIVETVYEGFCASPKSLIDRMVKNMPGLRVANASQIPTGFQCSTGRPLSNTEEERIRSRVHKVS